LPRKWAWARKRGALRLHTMAATTAARLNVLLIVADDLRHLHTVPAALRTPHTDRLTRQAVEFDNAHANFPVCGPSRASFLTGLRTDTLETYHYSSNMRDSLVDVMTMPQLFGLHGYTVSGMGKVSHGWTDQEQDDPTSWNDGFYESISSFRASHRLFHENGNDTSVFGTFNKAAYEDSLPDSERALAAVSDVGEVHRDGSPVQDDTYHDGFLARLAVAKLRQYAANATLFFLAVGLRKPHLPFNAPKAYWGARGAIESGWNAVAWLRGGRTARWLYAGSTRRTRWHLSYTPLLHTSPTPLFYTPLLHTSPCLVSLRASRRGEGERS
jgi:iduronate 2-sulfatase